MANKLAKDGYFRQKQVPYTVVPNSIVKNRNIPLAAKGLYLLIRYYINIPNFKLYKSYLKTICIEGEHTFNKNWKILKDFGYLTQVKENSGTGYVYIYDLKDSPEGENPHLGNPHLGNPGVGNHCLEKEISNKQVSNNNESIIKETIDTERIRKMLDPFINIEIQRAKDVNADPQEVRDSFKDFLIALSSYKDPDMIRKINIYGQDPVFDLWKKVYEELYDTSILGRPNRTVFNKIGYIKEMIMNDILKEEF